MQPRVTVALATVWLTVGLVGGTVTLRLPHDQYFPSSPRHPSGVQRDQTENSRDHNSAEDQPLDLWIGSRRSISSAEESPNDAKFAKRGFPLDEPLRDIVSSKQVYALSNWQERLPSIADAEFAADKVDYGEMPETFPRVAAVPPSDFSDDPFVADDTFQDQGPGSVEIYKLDLSKEKALLTATTPSVNSSLRNKGKAPKKTGRLDTTKTKVMDVKPPMTTTESKIHHRQSNFFDEQRTETPTVNRDVAFGVGGVPELQVGCEGLEASSSSSHKAKRSIDTAEDRMRKEQEMPASALVDMTPVSLDFDYDLSTYDEAEFEEMDELLKLKRLETTTRINRPNRGDMDASHLNSDHLDESRRSEKLPVRGDLGRTSARNSDDERIKAKRGPAAWVNDDAGMKRARGRRLLWLATTNIGGFADVESERKRAKRSTTHWGYGENEGVVSSNELQTVNQRRRQHDMRHYEDASGRKQPIRETDLAIEDIRRQYEHILRQKEEMEERQRRRMQQEDNRRNRWEEGKIWRNEMQRRLHEEYHRKMAHDASTPRTDDEQTRQRQMEERRRQEAARNRTQEMARRNELEERRREEEDAERRRRLQEEELRRRYPQNRWHTVTNASGPGYPRIPAWTDAERRRKQYEEMQKRRTEEARRHDQYRSQQEMQRRKEAEERQRQEDSASKLSEDDRRRLEERRREWAEKRRQEEEHEKRRQQPPSNLMSAGHRIDYRPNDVRQSRDRDEERRIHEQKLREYIARNRPINVDRRLQEEQDKRGRMNASMRVSQDEEYHRRLAEQRRRHEEERKLQDYVRRNQPVNLKSNTTGRDLLEERRRIEEARRRGTYPDPGARRYHGPSASTYIDPRGSLEEVRRRQQEIARRLEEERRKELASRRQYEQEEEKRRLREEWVRKEAARREEEATQARRYEQDRKRQEAASLQAERQRQEMLRERSRIEAGRTRRPEATRPTYYQDPRLFEEHRRQQESRPIPSNLTLNQAEARRVMAERKMQEAERRRAEANRMRDYKWKETSQWRQQELTRLNSLPVSARIIVRSGDSSSGISIPPVISRMNFDNEINFSGINPNRQGVPAYKFPAPPTSRPLAKSPGPCVWAVVHCCSSNNNRRLNCFESMGCPGSNWDPNPCRNDITRAARERVMKFYAEAENQQ